MLRPFIIKVSVLGYFSLCTLKRLYITHTSIYLYIINKPYILLISYHNLSSLSLDSPINLKN